MKLTIEKAIYGGAGLARSEGKAVFVPMTLPGETVEAAIGRDKGSFAEAELLSILEASPERVTPPCPHYGACGGCQYQHASYNEQLAMKRGILAETLSRAGLLDLPAITTHAAEPWGYRNRIRVHLDPASQVLGYRRRASHTLMAVETCPIAAPLLLNTLNALHALVPLQQAGKWCTEMELFTNHDESALLLSAKQRPGATASEENLIALSTALEQQVPQLIGSALFRAAPSTGVNSSTQNPAQHSRQKRSRPKNNPANDPEQTGALIGQWGQGSLTYRVGEDSYSVSIGAFFQGNRLLVDPLRRLATNTSTGTSTGNEGSTLAWDLFAGVGLFATALARRYTQVVAVEGAPISAADLRRNLAGHRVVESSTLTFLAREAHSRVRPDRIRPDLVLLDPPRAGLGVDATRLLAKVRPMHITYVSCDPATLARDLRILVDAGYTISQLHLIDMFPQTFHLETVAMLELR